MNAGCLQDKLARREMLRISAGGVAGLKRSLTPSSIRFLSKSE